MYDSIPGMAAAQRSYDNMEDPRLASECDCPPLFMCPSCDDTTTEPGQCDHAGNHADFGPAVERIFTEREDSQILADASCSTHGWCTGCTSRWCEDCNG